MATARGRCSNFDLCTTADRRTDVDVPAGQPFVCPECGKTLGATPESAQRGGRRFAILLAVLFVVVGGAVLVTSLLAPKTLVRSVVPPWITSGPKQPAAHSAD